MANIDGRPALFRLSSFHTLLAQSERVELDFFRSNSLRVIGCNLLRRNITLPESEYICGCVVTLLGQTRHWYRIDLGIGPLVDHFLFPNALCQVHLQLERGVTTVICAMGMFQFHIQVFKGRNVITISLLERNRRLQSKRQMQKNQGRAHRPRDAVITSRAGSLAALRSNCFCTQLDVV